ncbi:MULTISPECIES: glycosyltransferase family 4 protein [unclassified Thermosynechococcus]|uniref:glycosyltransferase family 4 protein n=1 Tax=unclassified Thermosynechococcus TaxID=2622553 RepID=UPI0019DF50AB|nr:MULTISPECIES: glycosyltransferase family 4 protein [unclassified Thermosynechococcus]HIK22121.1 glycosyltransferase family 4 protein [Thermosynechococcus sp. M3746_W2019_013]
MALHIAWLGKKSPPCGNVTYSREITNGLLDRGYQVSFLHFAQEDEQEAEREGEMPDVTLPCLYKSQVYTLPSLRANKVLVESLKKLKPDIVHASLTLSPLDFFLPDICEELKIPLVATFHPAYSEKYRTLTAGTALMTYQLYAPFLARYDRVIVFSQSQKELLIRLGVGAETLRVIPNGVDTRKYTPGPSTAKEDFKARYLYVYQGRMAIEKNVEALLRAWCAAEMPSDCKLLMVGGGALMTSLMANYGPEQNILWLGSIINDQERLQILRGCDVFILPSQIEGLSLSLLEAMACGLACLATDVGADGEVLTGAGIVLNPQYVKTQLQALLPIFYQHPEMIRLLGDKARQRVLQRYSLSHNLDRLEACYQEVMTSYSLVRPATKVKS